MNNLELTISTIIGGVILSLLIGYSIFYSNFFNSKTINEINTISTFSLEEIVEYDFSKIGYRAGSIPIIEFDSTNIRFKADLDNNGILDTIHYYFDNGLTRLVNPGQKTFLIPNVSKFSITVYDSSNTITNLLSKINSINLKIALNSKNQLNDTTFFAASYFEEIYFIKN
ncbi:MAG: hypothetical protein IPH62_10660 [Ignavibacteriae bacterium]|nr:hypothetical protein [Ignavibacteriota bacterium]